MSDAVLPIDGTVRLAALAAAFESATSLLRVPPNAQLRVVAVRLPDQGIVPFASTLRVGVEPTSQEHDVIKANDVYLIEDNISTAEFDDPEGLPQFVQGWRHLVSADGPSAKLQDSVQVSRRPSGTDGHPFPHWQFTLYELANPLVHQQVPRSPVANSARKIFASSIPEAAAAWLDDPVLKQTWTFANNVQGILWDMRAVLTSVDFEDDQLVASVSTRIDRNFYCSVAFDGSTAWEEVPVKDGHAVVLVPRTARSYQIHLLATDDHSYDDRRGDIPGRTDAANPARGWSRAPNLLVMPYAGGLLEHSVLGGHAFIDEERIRQLRAVSNERFDLRRLIRLCEELNTCYANECWMAVIALTRALIDQVPPIFEAPDFKQVANNYAGRSLKDTLQRLDTSARSIADTHLHQQIRTRETLPTRTQVHFAQDLDVLLGEVVRLLG